MRRISTPRIQKSAFIALAGLWFSGFQIHSSAAETIVIGSKKFTESYVLAEIAKHLLGATDVPAEHRQGMGGTIILWQALRTNQIATYPEYTGTIAEEILKNPGISEDDMRTMLAKDGVVMSAELGFNNTYALVMRRATATAAGIRTISDLRAHPELRFGLTHEFLDRRDGWQPLVRRYDLNAANVKGIDHGIGYEALRDSSIDVKDAYSTDAKIAEYDLVALEDDLHFFPQYKAVFLYRDSLGGKARAAIEKLAGTIDEARMIRLNAEAERTKNYARAAQLYFREIGQNLAAPNEESLTHKLIRWTSRHLQLAGLSLLLAIIVGVPLGIVASRGGAIGHVILGFSG
ncbi:MAG TPA: glycine betaine ABC transporter substrate-binding protein, partial [Chthoniobacterales bacterium]